MAQCTRLRWQLSVFLLAFLGAASEPNDGEFPRELLTIDSNSGDFVESQMEPRHAVAVVVAGKGSKRHQLLQELAKEHELSHLLAMGIRFAKGKSSLTLHRFHYDPEVYEGKWSASSLRSWLRSAAYPLVNRLKLQFAPAKYLKVNPFGVLLVVKPIKWLELHSEELVKALEPFARRLQERIKFTIFAKTSATQKLCAAYGIKTSSELVLIEKPQEIVTQKRSHSHLPQSPKYRTELGDTLEGIAEFLENYEAGKLSRYFFSQLSEEQHRQSSSAQAAAGNPLRELSGWDFLETVQDRNASVLVEFYSANCDSCQEFEAPYLEVARRVQHLSRDTSRRPSMSRVVIARIDQSANEHSETIKGTPWLRFWPRGWRKKRPLDVELREVDRIMEYLDEQESASVEADEANSFCCSLATSVPCTVLDYEGKEGAGGKPSSGCDGKPCCATGMGLCSSRCKAEEPVEVNQATLDLGKPTPGTSRGYLHTEADAPATARNDKEL